ncbi:hypothetical protein ACH5RR_037134, partial [Cinchona calisaya]
MVSPGERGKGGKGDRSGAWRRGRQEMDSGNGRVRGKGGYDGYVQMRLGKGKKGRESEWQGLGLGNDGGGCFVLDVKVEMVVVALLVEVVVVLVEMVGAVVYGSGDGGCCCMWCSRGVDGVVLLFVVK